MSHRWCESALLRKKQIEEGLDLTFNEVFLPYYKAKMLAYKPINALEIGCGTGHMAANLSKHCNSFTALEPSKGMYEVAKEVLRDSNVKLLPSYIQDISGTEKYDLIYSHMCLQVIEDTKELLRNVRGLILEKGIGIFSIPHPCFYNDYKSFFDESEYEYMRELEKQISFTITKDPGNKIESVPYHHRPISYYLNQIIECGFNILSLDEIIPSDEVQLMYGEKWKYPRYCSFVIEAC